MNEITWGLLVLAAGFAAVAVWLGLGRARLVARLAAVEAEAAAIRERSHADLTRASQELQTERQRATAEIQRLQHRLDEAIARTAGLQTEAARLSEQLTAAEELHQRELANHEEIYRERIAALERQKHVLETEFRARLDELNQRFRDEFQAIAGNVLKSANDEFFKRNAALMEAERQRAAQDLEVKRAAVDLMIRPISETLEKTGQKLAEIDRARVESASTLAEHLRVLTEGNQHLRNETARLVQALREPQVRGRYGEMQLRRVAELAGMQPYCDFYEQQAATDDEGNASRPDMVVHLPSERIVVVDAKTNIQAYLDALHARDPDEAEACLERFAKHVADQAAALARKKYWAQFDGSPEFVVMFIPGDQFIDAALSRRPGLLEEAARLNVLIAGPATLIGLLRAVAVGYREQKLARDAAELRALGVEFHERASIAFTHAAKLGEHLESAVKKYNDFFASYQSRLEPTLRKFEEAGVRSGKELPEPQQVEVVPRTVTLFTPALPAAAPGEADVA